MEVVGEKNNPSGVMLDGLFFEWYNIRKSDWILEIVREINLNFLKSFEYT